jgi:PhnB protein
MPTLSPYLTVTPGADAIDWYKRALGAEEIHRMQGPDGRIMHAGLKIGDSILMLADEFPDMGGKAKSPKTLGGTTVTVHVQSPDVDAAFKRAVDAGATVLMAPADMFWGDRFCKLADPFGHFWSIATTKEKLSIEEMDRRGAEWMKNLKPKG